MAWRKWIVRGVVYGIVALCGGAALAYQRWTNPAAVREQVIAKLQEIFPAAQVSVDSARLRILGGIQLNGLRFSRRDDPEHNEFLQVPSAVFYHDKQKILDGELALRKIELHQPRLRIRRTRDGKFNIQGLTRPVPPDRPLPTIVVHQGVIQFEDHIDDAAAPLIEAGDVNITIINDPLPIVRVRGAASAPALGKLQVQGTLRRAPWRSRSRSRRSACRSPHRSSAASAMSSQPASMPSWPTDLRLRRSPNAHGELSYHPDAPLDFDVHCALRRGKLDHPRLPLPLEQLTAMIHCTSSRLRLSQLSARSGPVEIHGDATATLPALEEDFEAHLDVKHLALGAKLCDCLPDKVRTLNDLFQPHGPATVHIACARRGGQWCNLADGTATRVSLRPEDVAMCFKKFAYPMKHLTGTLDYSLDDRRLRVDLSGQAGGQPLFITGSWQGEGKQLDADFDIRATDVPIDETLLTALPRSEQKLARSFRAAGKADIKAHVRHTPGAAAFRNEYHVRVHDATSQWEAFPCPLEQVARAARHLPAPLGIPRFPRRPPRRSDRRPRQIDAHRWHQDPGHRAGDSRPQCPVRRRPAPGSDAPAEAARCVGSLSPARPAELHRRRQQPDRQERGSRRARRHAGAAPSTRCSSPTCCTTSTDSSTITTIGST